MKKLLIWCFVCLLLVGCAPETQPTVRKEPPHMTVTWGKQSVIAMRQTETWTYRETQTRWVSRTASLVHPLEQQMRVPALKGRETGDFLLTWEAAPTSVTALCWPADSWGDSNAVSQELTLQPENGAYRLTPMEDHRIYQIKATWTVDANHGGTAFYCFYTTDRK